MPALQGTEIADLVLAARNDLGELKLTDVMSDLQDTVVLKRMMKKGKMEFQTGGGTEFEFNLITGTNGSARGVGLYYQAAVNPTNVLTRGKMPWRHATYNYAIERREIAMNASPRMVVDLVKTRRIAGLGDWVEHCEEKAWRVPSASNEVDFHGIPYWIVKSNTAVTTNNGFNGTVPSGYTVVANISPTTYERWRNYATQYSALTKDDVIEKLRRAMSWTSFKPLVENIKDYNTGDSYGLYTTYTVTSTLKNIMELQNDDLGPDIDAMEGDLVIRRTPFVWVRQLEEDTTNPIYGINWGVFKFKGLRGEWLHETQFDKTPNQPTVSVTHIDSTFNTICYDRRRNFVLATDTTMPS